MNTTTIQHSQTHSLSRVSSHFARFGHGNDRLSIARSFFSIYHLLTKLLLTRKTQSPIHSNPQHDLTIRKVPLMIPNLPNRQIRLVAVSSGIIHKLAYGLPEFPTKGLAELLAEVNAILSTIRQTQIKEASQK